MTVSIRMHGKPITDVLALLDAGQAESAWRIFLKNYNPSIIQVVNQYENDRDLAADCFLFVCEKFCENDFGRLRQFDINRGVRFRTWLHAVVSHLCVDWRRKQFGRPRPSSAIGRLPDFEQLVYQLKYEQGLDLESSFNVLKTTCPGKGRDDISAAIRHIHEALRPRQRWRLSFRKRQTVPAQSVQSPDDSSRAVELTEPGPGPERVAQITQERESLLNAMSSLDRDQRLLLRLRYQEDLSLKEVARLSGLNDASQARHRINAALAALGAILTSLLPAA